MRTVPHVSCAVVRMLPLYCAWFITLFMKRRMKRINPVRSKSVLFTYRHFTIIVRTRLIRKGSSESAVFNRMQNVGEHGQMALLGHSLAAYISMMDKEQLRKLTTRIQSDTTLWLCRLFRYDPAAVCLWKSPSCTCHMTSCLNY